MLDTILIVDDSKDYAALLEDRLKAEGFGTLTAYDGVSALQAARSQKPDLILLDILMPGVGGTEVRRELAADPATKDIPIVFLTGLRAPTSSKRPSIDGVKTIGKSKDFRELLNTIRELLAKSVR